MRRMFVVLGCVVGLSIPAWAGGDFEIFGAYAQTVENDSGFGVGGRISLGGRNLMVDLTSTWLRQSSPDVLTEGGAPFTDEITITPVELGVRVLLGSNPDFRVYVGAGGSYFLVDSRYAKVDDELGFYVNAGFFLGPTRGARIVGELIYRTAGITADYGPAGKVDLDVGGLGGLVGLSFAF